MRTYKEDYYAILGITKNASIEEIKTAYKEKITYYHPNAGQVSKITAEYMSRLLNEAYETLSDKDKKRDYDMWLNRNETAALSTENSSTPLALQSTGMIDHYNALNIKRDASKETIKAAYLSVLKTMQPDVQQGSESAALIVSFAEEAYRVLSNPDSKKNYDLAYDKAHPKTETPHRPTQPNAAPIKKESPLVTRAPQTTKPQTRTPKSTTPVQAPQAKATKGNLITYINRDLLYKVSNKATRFGQEILLKDLYGLFYDDYSFQFATEVQIDKSEFLEPCKCVYKLSSVPGYTSLTEETANRPWMKNPIITIRGQKVLVIQATKLIPPHFIMSKFLGDCISPYDLGQTSTAIINILSEHPELLDQYFEKYKPKTI